ncbi:hypothetical protein CHELA1G11_12547 [Hyphomicrobiales bacterium]|nr:hypothetical protein CHELA1G2_11760 [Hyphomicrobiales bacterium]CAH1665535.1 hypothetical protein CHELA1G11_12547 [Hyphomicrobiales bacterium]
MLYAARPLALHPMQLQKMQACYAQKDDNTF